MDDSRAPEKKGKLWGRHLKLGRFGNPRGGSAAYVQVPTALKVARPGHCHKHGPLADRPSSGLDHLPPRAPLSATNVTIGATALFQTPDFSHQTAQPGVK